MKGPDYRTEFRRRTTRQLEDEQHQWTPGTEPRLALDRELRRRDRLPNEMRSWIAIALSAIAIAVSIWTALREH